MNQTIKEKKETAIDNYDDFNTAILDIHRNIDEHPCPALEVSDRFFQALTKGKQLNSMTWGSPGVRIFKVGTRDEIEAQEAMPAEQFREAELKRQAAAVKK